LLARLLSLEKVNNDDFCLRNSDECVDEPLKMTPLDDSLSSADRRLLSGKGRLTRDSVALLKLLLLDAPFRILLALF
jgi:hypothetical protein